MKLKFVPVITHKQYSSYTSGIRVEADNRFEVFYDVERCGGEWDKVVGETKEICDELDAVFNHGLSDASVSDKALILRHKIESQLSSLNLRDKRYEFQKSLEHSYARLEFIEGILKRGRVATYVYTVYYRDSDDRPSKEELGSQIRVERLVRELQKALDLQNCTDMINRARALENELKNFYFEFSGKGWWRKKLAHTENNFEILVNSYYNDFRLV